MRWFVEVSRVGENNLAERYCVEAKQWQAALQEARKLRGDTGALSQFSIELLDNGYRAVDPALKLRYLVNHAPDDAALTEPPNRVAGSEGAPEKPRLAEAVKGSLAPVSMAAAAGSSLVPRPGSHSPPRPQSVNPPRASNAAPRLQQMVVPDDPIPPAPPLPGSFAAVAAAAPLLSFELVRERAEEARTDSPITYRELAYAVAPGVTQAQVEALLLDRYQAARAAIADRPAGKFVQLAVFDHVFKRRPERPPLATFAWKDWRGEPVFAFPGFGDAPMGPLSQVPPAPASLLPPSNGATLNPPPAASLSVLPPPPAPVALSVTPAAAPVMSEPRGTLAPLPMVTLNPVPRSPTEPALRNATEPAPRAPTEPAPPTAVAPGPPSAAAPAVVAASASSAPVPELSAPSQPPTVPAPASAPAFELTFEHPPSNPANAAPKSSPGKERVSRPRLAIGRRRAAGEDLISELFEFMHELHFQRDFAAGAEFVLSVLNEMLPCEGVLIHVFDINTGHFVVVRAKGPNASSVLLQRMPDQDPFVNAVMRSPQSVAVPDAGHDPFFQGPRWQAVGVVPAVALAGAVQEGGRYLGLIELVNPLGDAPFHAAEVNALDYICAQFAEFLSKKPLVLAADVVLAR
ncbi:MAG: hypothetical protein ABJB12_24020, partial [Pseudomonadota bacterium]